MKDQVQLPTPAALYARVSSDRQDVDLSVAAQLRALRDYARDNGYTVAREYIDEAESGRIADRPQFRRMIDEGGRASSPFQVILVWKFSRFTRKREHAVAFKSMLRRKGIRVVSITEHADDSPTGKLMEAIIESVDEFYSENLAQEVIRGMREAASRGFWMGTCAPYGYRKVYVQDGAKKRPRLELDPPADKVVRRIFQLALKGKTLKDVAKTLDAEGVSPARGKKWSKTTIVKILNNEAYTGALVWGSAAKDGAPPVRVEKAFPSIVSKRRFLQARRLLESRAPSRMHPRRAASPYLFSGLLKCETCGTAMSASEAKSGRYTYYVCHSLRKRGSGTCKTPRLNARNFEEYIVGQIQENILAESNIRGLIKALEEEMEGVVYKERQRLATIEEELDDVKRKLGRIWHIVETEDINVTHATHRIREHRDRQELLEVAAEDARWILSERRALLDRADAIVSYAVRMSKYLRTCEYTETRAFVRSFVKEIQVKPGRVVIAYSIPTPNGIPVGRPDFADFALTRGLVDAMDSGNQRETRTAAVDRDQLGPFIATHVLPLVHDRRDQSAGQLPSN